MHKLEPTCCESLVATLDISMRREKVDFSLFQLVVLEPRTKIRISLNTILLSFGFTPYVSLGRQNKNYMKAILHASCERWTGWRMFAPPESMLVPIQQSISGLQIGSTVYAKSCDPCGQGVKCVILSPTRGRWSQTSL